MRETTALGAAAAAGFALKLWTEQDIKEMNRKNRRIFKPEKSKEESEKMFARWEKAVKMSTGWEDK